VKDPSAAAKAAKNRERKARNHMSHETPRVFKSPSGQSEVTVNGIGFDEAVDFMQANGWRELPVATEVKAEPQSFDQVTMLRELLAESQSREKQERALRAEAEADVAKLRERVAMLEAQHG
jgi:hypothetical protein